MHREIYHTVRTALKESLAKKLKPQTRKILEMRLAKHPERKSGPKVKTP